MYTCLIADDHIAERDLIKVFIQKIPELQLVTACSTGLEIPGRLVILKCCFKLKGKKYSPIVVTNKVL